jgi:hypothetical protein
MNTIEPPEEEWEWIAPERTPRKRRVDRFDVLFWSLVVSDLLAWSALVVCWARGG